MQEQNIPVNVAKPQWQCPHCHKLYHDDYDTALACAQLGPADDANDGVIVLDLAGDRFGVAEVGKVTVERDGTGTPVRHRRDLNVAGKPFDARLLDGYTAGELAVIRPNEGRAFQSSPLEYGRHTTWIDQLFGATRSYGRQKTAKFQTPPKVWVGMVSWDTTDRWWGPLDDAQRAAFDMLTSGLLTRLAELDVETLTQRIVAAYDAERMRRHASIELTVGSLHPADTGVAIARAHGAPNLIWAARWLSEHIDAVAAWHADALLRWGAGDEVTIPRPPRLWLSQKLPNKPGKRREATMAPFGDDYRSAWDALCAQIGTTVDGPVVDRLGDVVDELRGAAATVKGGS